MGSHEHQPQRHTLVTATEDTHPSTDSAKGAKDLPSYHLQTSTYTQSPRASIESVATTANLALKVPTTSVDANLTPWHTLQTHGLA